MRNGTHAISSEDVAAETVAPGAVGPDAPDSRERILDAAEAAFSEDGFGGAVMKSIAASAGVAHGLLHYHYGSKEGLYEAVIERRSTLINTARLAMLDAVDPSAPDARARTFEAFFTPPLGPAGGGPRFARIFASLSVGGARDRALVRRCYDPAARRFIDALCAAEPRADRAVAAQAYGFALGTLIGCVGRDGRVERLGGPADGPDAGTDALVARLVRFAVGGLDALLDDTP